MVCLAVPPELDSMHARLDLEAIRQNHYAMEHDLVMTIPGPAIRMRPSVMHQVVAGAMAAALMASTVNLDKGSGNQGGGGGWGMGGRRDKGWNPKRRKLEKAAKKKNRKRK